MDYALIGRLIADKLHERTTYVLTLVVGTIINAFGQFLVPWFRSGTDPFGSFWEELQVRPGLALFSVLLGYAFPFCVGIYSGVAARYKWRRLESIADFPERKPDPVFRATHDGRLVEVGAKTQDLFDRYGVATAQQVVGEKVWADIVSTTHDRARATITFEPEGARYLVAHAHAGKDEINVYMTRLPD